MLVLIQMHALCSSPTWSISSTIVFARLADAKREFGPIRAMATAGWMSGCVLVSLLGADRSTVAGYGGAVMWLVVAAFTWWLPELATPKSAENLTWAQRLGLDALTLLRERDHRVVFLTTALFTIPLAGFYPYTPPHLQEVGLERTSAWMSVGQVTEVLAMFALGPLLLRWRLKWIIGLGLGFGAARFALCALDTRTALLAGVVLHGCSFTLVLITAQIYLDQRVDPAWRARGQALMSVLYSGAGSLLGYLGTGAWFVASTREGATRWPVFWGGLAVAMAAITTWFLLTYRGRGVRPGGRL